MSTPLRFSARITPDEAPEDSATLDTQAPDALVRTGLSHADTAYYIGSLLVMTLILPGCLIVGFAAFGVPGLFLALPVGAAFLAVTAGLLRSNDRLVTVSLVIMSALVLIPSACVLATILI